jgi:trehalose 6-phosphate synthase/phosphatase
MSRLLIVSNRLPITITQREGRLEVARSPGGLATGLAGPHERGGGLWIGWPGETGDLGAAGRAEVEARLAAMRAVPVWLAADEAKRFYEGFCNSILWPVFHYLLDQLPMHVHGWAAYERANRRFAEVVAEHHRPGDLVWVHDYQLMLVPRFLRDLIPDVRIGYFLHIPFPSSEVFRTLPFREHVLEGLLGADLIGFHTTSYLRHFASSLLRVLGIAPEGDRLRVAAREVRLGAFPMGIDARRFSTLAERPAIVAEARSLRGGGDDCALLLGVDRLDYTKGITRRLLAFEELLRRHPELVERVRHIQVAVPSRTDVQAYKGFRRELEGLVGRLNGALGTPRWVPIHYVYRNLTDEELVALYRATDVMVVTPVRDGMNLVAKEFVASRPDEDGVLVLSEFAGAASELREALLVNPFDVEQTAEMYARALALPVEERQARMRTLRRRVFTCDVEWWSRAFLDALEEASAARALHIPVSRPDELRRAVARMREADRLVLLLDYDGTLVPFAPLPELASPDSGLVELLGALATRPRTAVHVMSGRPRETLERWLGTLPIGLHAEHGLWSRAPNVTEWIARGEAPGEWRERVRAIIEQFAVRTPGSLVEEKTGSIAWHYRMADPELGTQQASELRLHLAELLRQSPFEVLVGEKVVEVRPRGVSKSAILRDLPEDSLIVALGDDRTDEELFAALPMGGLAVHVGPSPSRAALRLAGVAEARRLLEALRGNGAGA